MPPLRWQILGVARAAVLYGALVAEASAFGSALLFLFLFLFLLLLLLPLLLLLGPMDPIATAVTGSASQDYGPPWRIPVRLELFLRFPLRPPPPSFGEGGRGDSAPEHPRGVRPGRGGGGEGGKVRSRCPLLGG